MTHFFALPDEAEAWLDDVVERFGLSCRDEPLPGGGRRCLLWPGTATPPARSPGVVVDLPHLHGETLTMGETGWGASGVGEPTASEGRRLNQRLTRSLRRIAPVPLHALSYDGRSRAERPFAWGTPGAVDSGYTLRQFRDGAVTFVR